MSTVASPDVPPRWLRTLPWLAGLLIGASAHLVWWTQCARPGGDGLARAVPTAVHVHIHPPAPAALPAPAAHRAAACSDACSPVRRGAHARGRAVLRPPVPSHPWGARGTVVCADDGCVIRRDFVKRLRREPDLLGPASRVAVVPATADTVHLMMLAVEPSSLAHLLGLRTGDEVLGMGGMPLRATPEQRWTFPYRRSNQDFAVIVLRDGERHVLRHALSDR